MARVSGTASLGMKISLGHKKGYDKYDNASPHHSITIEREVSNDLSDEELAEKADELNSICRKLVEKKINADIKDLNKAD